MRAQYIIPLFSILLLFVSSCTPQQPSAQDAPPRDITLKQLKTPEELQIFLRDYQQSQSFVNNGRILMMASEAMPTAAQDAGVSARPPSPQTKGVSEYSQTNVQVVGVDEADFVKNDGKYIYMIQNNQLLIIEAYPPATPTILAQILLEGNAQQLFLNNNRVVIFSSHYGSYNQIQDLPGVDSSILPPVPSRETTLIHMFDVTDRKNPIKITTLTAPGNYYQSRMVGEYVYLVSQESVSLYDSGYPISLPAIREDEKIMATSPVSYFDVYMPQLVFNHITAFNIKDYNDIGLETLMMGYANTLYMSENNLYIAHHKDYPYVYYRQPRNDQEEKFFTVVVPVLPGHIQGALEDIRQQYSDPYGRMQKIYRTYQDLFNQLSDSEKKQVREDVMKALADYEEKLQEEQQKTLIHRFSIDGAEITYVGKGEVKGSLLNQFSLDESQDHLRVATTFYLYGSRSTSYNNVYILDEDLETVGSLERVAPDERIYSTRFIGDRLYMVTFRQVDPFFVIDLAEPTNPQILGALKIPGFSDYLHPYDDNHIIGVGKDTEGNQFGGVQTAGLKLALFDVSEVSNPKQRATYLIGGRGTYSEALYDHKAFLFSKAKDLLVIPVQEVKNDDGQNQWVGAYAFTLTPGEGFVLLGKVDHAVSGKANEYQHNQVRRALYIDDVLYTLSQHYLKINSLQDLQQMHPTIKLPQQTPVPYYPLE